LKINEKVASVKFGDTIMSMVGETVREKALDAISARMDQGLRRLHGNYKGHTKMAIEAYVLGQFAVQLRKWIPPTWEAWWGGTSEVFEKAHIINEDGVRKFSFRKLAQPDAYAREKSEYSGVKRIGRVPATVHFASAYGRYWGLSIAKLFGVLKNEQNLIEAKLYTDPVFFTEEEK